MHVSFGWICRSAARFMAVNLLIRKYIKVFDDFATTDANSSVSDHSCLKFTAHMIKLVCQSVNSFVDFSRRHDVY